MSLLVQPDMKDPKLLRAYVRSQNKATRAKTTAAEAQAAASFFDSLTGLASAGLGVIASFATGPGGYVLGLIVIHYAEKVIRIPHGPIRWNVFIRNKETGETGNLSNIGYDTRGEAEASASGINKDSYEFTVVSYRNHEGLLSGDEAAAAKALLATAAAAGVAGSIAGIFSSALRRNTWGSSPT